MRLGAAPLRNKHIPQNIIQAKSRDRHPRPNSPGYRSNGPCRCPGNPTDIPVIPAVPAKAGTQRLQQTPRPTKPRSSGALSSLHKVKRMIWSEHEKHWPQACARQAMACRIAPATHRIRGRISSLRSSPRVSPARSPASRNRSMRVRHHRWRCTRSRRSGEERRGCHRNPT